MRTTKPTTLRTWSDHEGDPTAEGLDIAGIMVTYAELVEIDSRESALDRGVTPELLEIWQNQGGRDYAQLVDWLYHYASEQENEQPAPANLATLIAKVRDALGATGLLTDEPLGEGWVFGLVTQDGTPISISIDRTP